MLVVLVLLVVPAFAILLQPGYFPIHDDLQVMRQHQMDVCFRDLQLPCRWVPDMGYGFGYPLFNFYPPLPYYIGQLVHILGFSFIDTAKIIGILGFVISALAMYQLAREFWGRKGGLLAAVLYVYAPYHSVDFYVRAAINEFFALAWFPFIFWSTYKLICEVSKKINSPSPESGEGGRGVRWVPIVAVSVALLLLSHNPMMMIFAPGYLLWIAYWAIQTKSLKSLKMLKLLTVSAFWALGLAAFFTLPVLFESKYAHLETLVIGYFNYLAHFADITQMFFDVNWGYGPSELGTGDGMSFAVGYLQWLIPIIIGLSIVKIKKHQPLILILLLLLLTSLFLMHSKSTELWKLITPLEFLQFPWRFLSLAIFYSAFISGAIVKVNNHKILVIAVVVTGLFLNVQYFMPRTWYPGVIDQDKLTGNEWRLARTASIFDYLPIWAPLPPSQPPVEDLVFIGGSGKSSTLAKNSKFQSYSVYSESPVTVQLQTMYFPGWKLYVDNQEVSINPKTDPDLGRIQTDIPAGTHSVTARFTNTPIRIIGNLLSLGSWLGLLIFSLWQFKTFRV